MLQRQRYECGPNDGVPGPQFIRAVHEFNEMNHVETINLDDWRDPAFIHELVERDRAVR